MNKIIIFLIVLFSVQSAHANYYRFWRGVKKSSLEMTSFHNSLNNKFIPETVNIGKKHGLISYMPIILDFKNSIDSEINEFALVVYKSEKDYLSYRATDEGIAYQNLHFDYFEKDKSRSLVPKDLETSKNEKVVKSENSYEIIKYAKSWQNKKVYFFITKKNNNSVKEILSIKALAYVILVEEGYIYHYVLEPNSGFEKLLSNIEVKIELQNTETTKLKLKHGEGINATFNCF